MKRTITTVALVIGLIGFIILGATNINRTNHKLKTQDIQLKSKQSDLLDLENRFNLLNKQLEDKNLTEQKLKELELQKTDLQKQLDDAQKQLQAKAAQREAEQQKIAQAASLTTKAYASSGCDAWIANAGITDLASAHALIARESGCNPYAVNKSSGACGVAQELPCGKSGCTLGDGACQVRWMNTYVLGRYGSWGNALAFHYSHNWY